MAFTYTCQDCGETYTQSDPSADERCPECRPGVVDL